ncbi:MAG: amidohydrolase [Alistipes sp.]|nr:amidohydrolase [Alistipes sp.]
MTAIEFRRELHRHPEISFEEVQTAQYIEKCLTEAGISHSRIAETGVLAKIEGKGDLSRAIVLRADIDALPIEEQSGLEYASENKGVMHACGHDIHAAVLYGVLLRLAEKRDFEGTVFGIFQPGEECNPGGASKVLQEVPFADYNIVAVVGEHTDSGLEVGELGFCKGEFMAANDELRFWVRGKGGHAAMRDKLNDTVVAAANLVTMLNAVNDENTVLSIGKVIADGATNVIPDEVYMEGTFRCFSEEHRRTVWQIIEAAAQSVDAKFGTTTEVDINHGYPAVVSNDELVDKAVALATENGVSVKMLPKRYTAEDFGHYCVRYPSLFYRLGVGTDAGRSHTSTFAPNEEAIEVGIDFMEKLAKIL